MTAFEHRGVVEGFYGPAYSHAERLAFIEDIGRFGMNRYLYAPKDDPLHREQWRTPYPDTAMDEFSQLITCGHAAGVSVGFAISPGLSIRYSDPTDTSALTSKFLAFRELGSRFFALALDDVPSTLQHEGDRAAYTSLAEAQVALTHAIAEAVGKDVLLWFVPTDYVGIDHGIDGGIGDDNYLSILGASLDPRIEVGWTGRTVVSPQITTSEAAARSKVLRRKLLVWDNVPVSDGPMRPMLHLGPFVGRDRDLPDHLSGVLLNPMEHPRASRLTVHTAADYLADPGTYDPERSWVRAATELGAGAEEAFVLFARAHRFSALAPDDRDEELEHGFERLRSAQSSKSGSAAPVLAELDALVAKRSAAATTTRSSLSDHKLLAEIEPWLDSYETECLKLRIAVDLLRVLEAAENPDANGPAKPISEMGIFTAYSRFQGRLTHLVGPTKASFGPRRVIYPQLCSHEDDAARFGDDPALYLDHCLADAIVRYAEARGADRLGAKIAPQ